MATYAEFARDVLALGGWPTHQQNHTSLVCWTAGDGFTLEERQEVDEEHVADQILAAIREHPGRGWGGVEKMTPGVKAEKRRAIRDGLFVRDLIVNLGKDEDGSDALLDHLVEKRPSHLYVADDPTIQHLRPGRDAGGTQPASASPSGVNLHLRPASGPIGTQEVDADDDGPEYDPRTDLYADDGGTP